ncbi:MAG: Flp pilus assembly complex ATPase component TadA [Candidatus Riflebacteria bacterium]|nr:Flp pilus assembly complex ATPase component TadA [Candidatus Riflebacteria bacterium]
MADFKQVCEAAKKIKASDVHIVSDEQIYCRVNGKIVPLPDMLMSQKEVKQSILDTSSPKALAILGKQKHVTYAADIEDIGKVRFALYFNRQEFALSARFIPDDLTKMLGLLPNPQIESFLDQNRGLILVGSPSGEGKSTTVASMLNYINNKHDRLIFTVENPVEYVHKDNRSTFIQRSIPIDIVDFYDGLSEAARIAPDIVVTDSISYDDAFDQALTLSESGCMVIALTEGGDCQQIIERVIKSRKIEDQASFRSRLATQLMLTVGQRLCPMAVSSMTRVPIFDIMENTQQSKIFIRNDNLTMFRTVQQEHERAASGGRTDTLARTFDKQLQTLLAEGKITRETAYDLAVNKQSFPLPKKGV